MDEHKNKWFDRYHDALVRHFSEDNIEAFRKYCEEQYIIDNRFPSEEAN